MMSFLAFLHGEKKKTASVARERLQIIAAHERSGRNAAEPDDIRVNLKRQGNLEVLEVTIELPDARRIKPALAAFR